MQPVTELIYPCLISPQEHGLNTTSAFFSAMSLLYGLAISAEACVKSREDKVAESEIREAVNKLRSLLSEAILAQSALVLELKWGRAWKSVITEAENRLKSLKAEFLADTGSEWSDVREEGPVLLTTNMVRGREVLPELQVKLKQLRRDNVLRLKSFRSKNIY